MKLSIIIVHHRTPAFLRMCLQSIVDTVKDVDFEVLVIDSRAMREAKDMVADFSKDISNIQYIPFKHNTGYAHGVNAGIKEAQGDYIFVLNPDAILEENSVQKMLDYMDAHPDIGMLGPKMLNFNGTHQQTYFRFYTPMTVIARRSIFGRLESMKKRLKDFIMDDTDPEELQTPDWLMGSALMVRADAIKKVGGMDEQFFMYFEDVDWARRFWHNGYKVVYFPDATVLHYHQRESKSRFGIFDVLINRKTRWHIASAIKFFWKYRDLSKRKANV